MNVICNTTKLPRRVVHPPAGITRPEQFVHEINDPDVVVLYVDGNAHAAPNADMPERLMVAGDLVVNCGAAARLPSDTWVGGDLLVVGSSGAATVDCAAANRLPRRTSVKGEMRVIGHSGDIVVLPPSLYVGGDLDLRRANAKFRIPPKLRVDGDLFTPDRSEGGVA